MTLRTAQKLAHYFSGTEAEAHTFAAAINEELEFTPQGPMVPVRFYGDRWGVMLRDAYEMVKAIGVVS